MDELTFGQRLIKIRKHFGITMTVMSEKLKTVKSNVSRYERDLNKPTISFLESLIKVYRINLNWLFGASEEMFLPAEIEAEISEKDKKAISPFIAVEDNRFEIQEVEYTSFGIPIFGDFIDESAKQHLLQISGPISAGEPQEIVNQGYDSIPLPIYKSSRDLDEYLVFRVNGLSMEPEIHHEDIVFIYKNDNWIELNNKIVAVRIHGEMTLKKLAIDNIKREIVFKPINKKYADIIISFELMKAISLIGELKAITRVYKKK
ncbi:MAG: helix-turn-helix domain-containing protein [Candidatus Cloacimonetes bacterium]|nr:helix-turn-helix domain-containing protein [Candidatus Cloacimonadota bacterium]